MTDLLIHTVLTFLIGAISGGAIITYLLKSTMRQCIESWEDEIKEKGIAEYLEKENETTN